MWKGIILTLIIGLAMVGLWRMMRPEFRSVEVAEFEQMIADGGYCVVDVRTAAEHAAGHIPHTDYQIDVLDERFTQQALATLPKEQPVALYCRSGNRSKKAAKILASEGYQVVELASGFKGWSAAGKAIEK